MRAGVLLGVEFSVDEDGAVVAEMDLVEVIHVELAHEGGEAVVPEVLGQDDFLQLLLVEYADALALGIPIDDARVLLRLSQPKRTRRMLYSLPINDAGLSSWFFIQRRFNYRTV
jgi:hypothetical protein